MFDGARPQCDHLGERGVMEDDIRRYALFSRDLAAARAQGLPQALIAVPREAGRRTQRPLLRLLRFRLAAQHQSFVAATHREQAARDELAEHAAPFGAAEFLADTEGAELVAAETADAVVVLAHQYIDQIIHAEALAGAVHAGEGLLRRHGRVPGLGRMQAGVTIAAGPIQRVIEV